MNTAGAAPPASGPSAAGGTGWPLAIFLAMFVLLWAVLPLLVGRVPPNDNLEQLGWSAAFQWGYAKHPPLPTWELIAASHVFPKGLPLTYALGALQVVAMLGFAWLLVRDTLGAARARVAILLITCILYYSHRMHFLNHNTVMLSAYAASAWFAWRALATPRTAWWVALGAAWGIGMLAKYQMVVGIAASLGFIAMSVERRSSERIRGVLVAGVVAAIVFAPHAIWIVGDRFSTIGYATSWVEATRGPIERVLDVLRFAGEQLGRLAPALVALGVLSWLARRRQQHASAGPALASPTHVVPGAAAGDGCARRALAWHAWGPFGFMALLSLAIGLDLGMPWGTAFLWMLPIWIVARPGFAPLAALSTTATIGTIVAIQALLIATFR